MDFGEIRIEPEIGIKILQAVRVIGKPVKNIFPKKNRKGAPYLPFRLEQKNKKRRGQAGRAPCHNSGVRFTA